MSEADKECSRLRKELDALADTDPAYLPKLKELAAANKARLDTSGVIIIPLSYGG